MPFNIQYLLLASALSLLLAAATAGCSSGEATSVEQTATSAVSGPQLLVPTATTTVTPSLGGQSPSLLPTSTITPQSPVPSKPQSSQMVWREIEEFNDIPCVVQKEPTQRSIGTAPPIDVVVDQSILLSDKEGDLVYELSSQLIKRLSRWISEAQLDWVSIGPDLRLSRLQELSTRLSTYCTSFRLIPASEELGEGFLEELAQLLQTSSEHIAKTAVDDALSQVSSQEVFTVIDTKLNELGTKLGTNETDDEFFIYDTLIGIQLEAPIDWLPVRDDSIFSISFGIELQEPISAVEDLIGWRVGTGLRVSNFFLPSQVEQERLDLIRTSLARRWGSPQPIADEVLGANSFHVIRSVSEVGWLTFSASTLRLDGLWVFEFVCGSIHIDECESIMRKTLESVSFSER